MAKQIFPVEQSPQVVLTQCAGDVTIEVWDEQSIEVETDGSARASGLQQGAVVIDGAQGDVRLRAPADTTITIEQHAGHITIRDVAAVVLDQIDGDVEITNITGPVKLRDIDGDLAVDGAASLTVEEGVAGDAVVQGVMAVEIDQVGDDLTLGRVQTAVLGRVGDDCAAREIGEVFRYGNIGGDLSFSGGSEGVAVVGGSAGGDLAIARAGHVQIGDVGGDVTIRSVSGAVTLGNAGSDCEIGDVAGDVSVGNIGGSARLDTSGRVLRVGNIGGDVTLTAAFQPESLVRMTVGGDAAIRLPERANITIRGTVGGEINGEGIAASRGGVFVIVYGEGAARLELVVGGDLDLHGGGSPRTSSVSSADWAAFGEEMGRFGRELGEELGRVGEELGRELRAAFGAWVEQKSDEWVHKAQQHAERVRWRVADRVRHAEERARRAGRAEQQGGHAGRMHVRINDREWRFDPVRLERLKQKAYQAAQEGVVGAMEAVERALAGLGYPTPAGPPPPPPSVTPPPATGATIRIERADSDAASQAAPPDQQPAAAPDLEEERAAILRMVAEGRISPAEGDMLLEALG